MSFLRPAEMSYGILVTLAAVVSFAIRRVESRRLGYVDRPGYRWVGLWCVIGAVMGARGAMFFYEAIPPREAVQNAVYTLGFDGKTILGALTGGYILGEVGKKVVGVRFSTGDALAIALPVGQAIGRLGCFFAGCCYGAPSSAPWAVHQLGALRHPVALYEAAACLALASVLAAIRHRSRPPGHLFRYYLIGYAAIRCTTEVFRGEPQVHIGPMSSAQLYCLLVGLAFVVSLRLKRRQSEPN